MDEFIQLLKLSFSSDENDQELSCNRYNTILTSPDTLIYCTTCLLNQNPLDPNMIILITSIIDTIMLRNEYSSKIQPEHYFELSNNFYELSIRMNFRIKVFINAFIYFSMQSNIDLLNQFKVNSLECLLSSELISRGIIYTRCLILTQNDPLFIENYLSTLNMIFPIESISLISNYGLFRKILRDAAILLNTKNLLYTINNPILIKISLMIVHSATLDISNSNTNQEIEKTLYHASKYLYKFLMISSKNRIFKSNKNASELLLEIKSSALQEFINTLSQFKEIDFLRAFQIKEYFLRCIFENIDLFKENTEIIQILELANYYIEPSNEDINEYNINPKQYFFQTYPGTKFPRTICIVSYQILEYIYENYPGFFYEYEINRPYTLGSLYILGIPSQYINSRLKKEDEFYQHYVQKAIESVYSDETSEIYIITRDILLSQYFIYLPDSVKIDIFHRLSIYLNIFNYGDDGTNFNYGSIMIYNIFKYKEQIPQEIEELVLCNNNLANTEEAIRVGIYIIKERSDQYQPEVLVAFIESLLSSFLVVATEHCTFSDKFSESLLYEYSNSFFEYSKNPNHIIPIEKVYDVCGSAYEIDELSYITDFLRIIRGVLHHNCDEYDLFLQLMLKYATSEKFYIFNDYIMNELVLYISFFAEQFMKSETFRPFVQLFMIDQSCLENDDNILLYEKMTFISHVVQIGAFDESQLMHLLELSVSNLLNDNLVIRLGAFELLASIYFNFPQHANEDVLCEWTNFIDEGYLEFSEYTKCLHKLALNKILLAHPEYQLYIENVQEYFEEGFIGSNEIINYIVSEIGIEFRITVIPSYF